MKILMVLAMACGLVAPLLAQNPPAVPAIVGPQAALTRFEQSLLDAEKTLINAADRGDVQYVENTLAADFVSVGSNGDTDPRSEFMNGVRAAKSESTQSKPVEEKTMLYFFRVVPLSEAAAVVSYDIVRPGDHPRYLHISDAWVQQAGQWKLKFQQATPKIWSAADVD